MNSKKKLTKAEIVDGIKRKVDIEPSIINQIINEFFVEVSDALKEGKTAELRGFGTFEVRTRKGREKARNPKTGESCSVAPHGVAVFRPGKELKEDLWDIVG